MLCALQVPPPLPMTASMGGGLTSPQLSQGLTGRGLSGQLPEVRRSHAQALLPFLKASARQMCSSCAHWRQPSPCPAGSRCNAMQFPSTSQFSIYFWICACRACPAALALCSSRRRPSGASPPCSGRARRQNPRAPQQSRAWLRGGCPPCMTQMVRTQLQ